MNKKFWEDMRANGFLLVDAEQRKIAIFANEGGELVIASYEGKGSCVSTICPTEFARLDELISDAKKIALDIDANLSADYKAHEVICKASDRK